MPTVWNVMTCLSLVAAPASAQPDLPEARAAFTEGRFLEAADLAEAVGGSNGFALAAEALAIHAQYEAAEEAWDAIVERATRMGEAARRADFGNPEAHYQYGHALGRYANGVGTMRALNEGLAGRTRDAFETALERDPDHAGAHLALGAWHSDVADEGFLARRIYGASRDRAVEHFERALELTPESPGLLYEYGIRLPALDRDRGLERAMEMLRAALELQPRNRFEEYVHEDIAAALEALTEDRR